MKPVKFVLTSAVLFLLLSLPFVLTHKPEHKPIIPPMLLEDAEPTKPFNLLTPQAYAQSSSISGLANYPTLQSNYLFVIAIPGVANGNISYGQLTNLLRALGPTNVAGVTYITNIFTSQITAIRIEVTTNIANYSFITNLYATTINATTNINNYQITTNLYAQFATNEFLTVNNTFNVSGKATMTVVNTLATTATNGFYVFTNIWSGGPTGTVDLALTDQGRASITACSITGVINKSNAVVESVVLSLTNTATTNWLLTLAAGIVLPQRTNQVVISNGTMATLSLRYHPAFGTNGVFVQF